MRHWTNSTLVESWDVVLVAGQTYTAFFTHDNTLNAKVCVFSPTSGVHWQPCSGAFRESADSKSLVAPVSGWHGVVVANDGGEGQFGIGVRTGVTAAETAPPPARDALRGASPNPGRAGLRLQYALHEGGDVTFDVIDMAGRRVAHVTPGAKGAGEWSEAWAATGELGRVIGTQTLTRID